MSNQPINLNDVLEKLQKVEDVSTILLDIMEGRIDKEKVAKLRRLAEEFVEEFELSGPIAWLVKVLPKEPILPGAPFLSVAKRLKLIDKKGITNVLSQLCTFSGVIKIQLQRSISEVDPPAIASSIKAVPNSEGRVLEVLSEVYLEKVKKWPELLPTDLMYFIKRRFNEKGNLKAGAPDLYYEELVGPKIWAVNVSKSFKKGKDYETSAEYVAELVNEYSNRMKGYKVGLNYAIVVYEEATQERHKRVPEIVSKTILNKVKDRINRNEFSVNLFDLSIIKDDLELYRKDNARANHLYATLREMGLIKR